MLGPITNRNLKRLRDAKLRREARAAAIASRPDVATPPPPAPVVAPDVRSMSADDFREYMDACGIELPAGYQHSTARRERHPAVKAALDARTAREKTQAVIRADELKTGRIDARAAKANVVRDRLRELGLADAAAGTALGEIPSPTEIDKAKAPAPADAHLERTRRLAKARARVMDKLRSLRGRPLDVRTLSEDEYRAYMDLRGLQSLR